MSPQIFEGRKNEASVIDFLTVALLVLAVVLAYIAGYAPQPDIAQRWYLIYAIFLAIAAVILIDIGYRLVQLKHEEYEFRLLLHKHNRTEK